MVATTHSIKSHKSEQRKAISERIVELNKIKLKKWKRIPKLKYNKQLNEDLDMIIQNEDMEKKGFINIITTNQLKSTTFFWPNAVIKHFLLKQIFLF